MSEVKTPPKRLVDLHPKWGSGSDNRRTHVICDCPCGLGAACPIGGRSVVPVKNSPDGGPEYPQGWDRTGDDFASMTLSPSIFHYARVDDPTQPHGYRREPHWHGFLRNGVMESC